MTIATLGSQTVDSNFDFANDGVLENANVKIHHAGQEALDTSYFANSHTLSLTLSAERRSGGTISKSESITIACADEKVALVLESLETPSVSIWAAETQYANYNARHKRAETVFGAAYTLTSPPPPDILYCRRSEFGYNGNLPASRYYAAYIKAQLRVVPMEEPPPTCEDRGNCPESKIPDTGADSSLTAQALILPGLVAVLAFFAHRLITRRNQHLNN